MTECEQHGQQPDLGWFGREGEPEQRAGRECSAPLGGDERDQAHPDVDQVAAAAVHVAEDEARSEHEREQPQHVPGVLGPRRRAAGGQPPDEVRGQSDHEHLEDGPGAARGAVTERVRDHGERDRQQSVRWWIRRVQRPDRRVGVGLPRSVDVVAREQPAAELEVIEDDALRGPARCRARDQEHGEREP